MQHGAARVILERFASPMRLAVARVLQDRNQAENCQLRDELEQEARILVVTYAGLMPGWQSGKLADWADQADGDEKQVALLMTNQLRLALSQILGRQDNRAVSLDAMLENGVEPVDYNQEDRMIEQIDNRSDLASYRELYPTLSRNVFEGMTQAEIAEIDGIPLRTIERRISKEKRAFLIAYVQHRGLRVEGDETTEELAEAYRHLTGKPPEFTAAELEAAA